MIDGRPLSLRQIFLAFAATGRASAAGTEGKEETP